MSVIPLRHTTIGSFYTIHIPVVEVVEELKGSVRRSASGRGTTIASIVYEEEKSKGTIFLSIIWGKLYVTVLSSVEATVAVLWAEE